MVSRVRSTGPKSQAKQAKRLSRAYRPLTRKEKDAKREYESYRRRRRCLGNKAFELNMRCKAQVFVIVKDKDGEHSHFWSSEELSDDWPPNGVRLASDSTAKEIPLRSGDGAPHRVRTTTVPRKRDGQAELIMHDSSVEAITPDTVPSLPLYPSYINYPALGSQSAQVRAFLGRFHDFSSQQAAMWRGIRTTIGQPE